MTKQKQTDKTQDELKELVVSLRKDLIKLSMDHSQHKLKTTTLLRTKKDELARALTQIRMAEVLDTMRSKVNDKKGDSK